MLFSILMSLLSAISFAVIFRVPPKALPAAGLVGLGAWSIRQGMVTYGFSPVAATFLAALFVAVTAESLARIQRMPSTVFTVAGIVTLVPGLAAFRTMRSFVAGDMLGGISSAVETSLVAGSIAAGVVLAGALARINKKGVRPHDRYRQEGH